VKHTVGLLSITAVLFFALAQLAPAQSSPAAGRMIVPESSIEHPWDIGVRAHTNIVVFVPDKMEFNENGAPIAENPASLACIYQLVTQTKGCPKTGGVVPTGGSKAIALSAPTITPMQRPISPRLRARTVTEHQTSPR
jgi:hypothetical protein